MSWQKIQEMRQAMKSILIRGGRVIDPDTRADEVRDLFLCDGKIAGNEETGEGADIVLDAAGCWVMPGLIDMHVHLRDPGQTWKEDIGSGTQAAAKGGITTVVAMANTKPVIDSPDRVDYVVHKAEQVSPVHVLQAGSATKGLKGEELSDIEGMVRHGSPAISEDGRSVMNASICRKVFRECARLDVPYLDHCEDADLVEGGCVNLDSNSAAQGLPGISNTVEDVIIARDILLAEETGCHLHLCHCSTKGSAEMLRMGKEKGLSLTGEVCPHHFTLTSDDRIEGDANFKMNPPLRTKEDVDALIRGLKEDVFDVISTDHAPHSREEKHRSMKEAPFGITGLETSVSLTITELVKKGILTPMQMAEKMSRNPARILKLSGKGSLAPGMDADVVIIDPEKEYVISSRNFVSRGKNTPFEGRKVCGVVRTTICGGKIVYQEGIKNND